MEKNLNISTPISYSLNKLPQKLFRKVALWDFTNKCDLKCIHCYNYDKYFSTTNKIETSTKQALEIVDKLADFGFEQIHFLGGEPYNRDDFFDITNRAKSHNMLVTVNTNGIRLSNLNVNKSIDSGISQIGISLDGPNSTINDFIRGKNSFNIVKDNITNAIRIIERRNSKLQVGVITTLTKPLVDVENGIYDFFPLLDSIGVNWINFIFLYKNSNAVKNSQQLSYKIPGALDKLEKELVLGIKKYSNIYTQLDCRPLFGKYLYLKYGISTYIYQWSIKCSAGNKTWLIESDGQVHPCGICSSPEYGQIAVNDGKFVYENLNILNTDHLQNIYKSDYFRSFRNYICQKQNYQCFETCDHCIYFCDVCLPCLIYSPSGPIHNRKRNFVEECEWTKKALNEFYLNQYNKIPIKNDQKISFSQKKDQNAEIYTKNRAIPYLLNRTAIEIWRLINNQNSINDISKLIFEKYKTSIEFNQVQRDVIDCLFQLKHNDLVSIK